MRVNGKYVPTMDWLAKKVVKPVASAGATGAAVGGAIRSALRRSAATNSPGERIKRGMSEVYGKK